MSSYIHMFGQLVSDRPAKPGVWKRKEGGYFVRARVMVRGKLKEIRKVLADTGATNSPGGSSSAACHRAPPRRS